MGRPSKNPPRHTAEWKAIKRIYDIAYRAKNRAKKKLQDQAWAERNRAKSNEIKKKWQIKNQYSYRKKYPERAHILDRRGHLRRKYGMAAAEFDAVLESQNRLCAICGSNGTEPGFGKFCVDHCHATGKVRGIVCHKCNLVLGFSNDNPEILQKAIEYLARPNTQILYKNKYS